MCTSIADNSNLSHPSNFARCLHASITTFLFWWDICRMKERIKVVWESSTYISFNCSTIYNSLINLYTSAREILNRTRDTSKNTFYSSRTAFCISIWLFCKPYRSSSYRATQRGSLNDWSSYSTSLIFSFWETQTEFKDLPIPFRWWY